MAGMLLRECLINALDRKIMLLPVQKHLFRCRLHVLLLHLHAVPVRSALHSTQLHRAASDFTTPTAPAAMLRVDCARVLTRAWFRDRGSLCHSCWCPSCVMSSATLILLAVSFSLLTNIHGQGSGLQTVQLDIDLAQRHDISPELYGIFFEGGLACWRLTAL